MTATVSELGQFVDVPIEILVSPPILQTDIVVSISVVGLTATGKSTVLYKALSLPSTTHFALGQLFMTVVSLHFQWVKTSLCLKQQ